MCSTHVRNLRQPASFGRDTIHTVWPDVSVFGRAALVPRARPAHAQLQLAAAELRADRRAAVPAGAHLERGAPLGVRLPAALETRALDAHGCAAHRHAAPRELHLHRGPLLAPDLQLACSRRGRARAGPSTATVTARAGRAGARRPGPRVLVDAQDVEAALAVRVPDLAALGHDHRLGHREVAVRAAVLAALH